MVQDFFWCSVRPKYCYVRTQGYADYLSDQHQISPYRQYINQE